MNWIDEIDDILAQVEDTAKGEEGDMITKVRGMINENYHKQTTGYTAMFDASHRVKTINKPTMEALRKEIMCIGDIKWVTIVKE